MTLEPAPQRHSADVHQREARRVTEVDRCSAKDRMLVGSQAVENTRLGVAGCLGELLFVPE